MAAFLGMLPFFFGEVDMGGVFIEGALLQASLIFALGAQNLFVLESGLKRQHPFAVSFTCFFCDLIIILLGVAGAATLFSLFPQVKIFIGVIGVVFLFQYGLDKILISKQIIEIEERRDLSFRSTILQAVSFSVLNPHAYLDGIVLIGGFSSKFPDLSSRIIFGLGAAFFSGVWFLFLSTASGYMKPLLENPMRMRKVMCTAGVTLMYLSVKLSADVFHWMSELQFHFQRSNTLTAIDVFRASGIF